eukprot:Lithocolla_globosa_v1_NODE_2110_length_2162_cov_22.530138.p2 type:complete len:143 gc:universal NODE_2110_length_2162_cov_22.530138:1257-829(-)
MLPGSCLGDDSLLAESFCKDDLPHRIINLMSPRVVEILSLQPYPRTPTRLGQPFGLVKRRWPPHITIMRLKFLPKFLIVHCFGPHFVQFLQCGHECFRNKLATEITEILSLVFGGGDVRGDIFLIGFQLFFSGLLGRARKPG